MNIESIKTARTTNKLTQAQVASSANITTIAYQRYEAGERIPSVHTAILIADTLKIKSYKEFKALFGAATPDNAKRPGGNPAKHTATTE